VVAGPKGAAGPAWGMKRSTLQEKMRKTRSLPAPVVPARQAAVPAWRHFLPGTSSPRRKPASAHPIHKPFLVLAL